MATEQDLTDLQVQQARQQQEDYDLMRPQWLYDHGMIEEPGGLTAAQENEKYTYETQNAELETKIKEAKSRLGELSGWAAYGETAKELRAEIDKYQKMIDDNNKQLKKIIPAPPKIRDMTEDEKYAGMTDAEKQAFDTEKIYAERASKAAKGELETPGYVTNELGRQREMQQGLLSRRLGAKGSKLSTAGIRSRADIMANEAAVKSNYAYGQEEAGMGLLGNYSNYLGNLSNQNQNIYGNFTNAGARMTPLAQTAMQPYTFGRQLSEEKDIMDLNRRNSYLSTGLNVAGRAGAAYITGGMGG